jgi:hypothetical protein
MNTSVLITCVLIPLAFWFSFKGIPWLINRYLQKKSRNDLKALIAENSKRPMPERKYGISHESFQKKENRELANELLALEPLLPGDVVVVIEDDTYFDEYSRTDHLLVKNGSTGVVVSIEDYRAYGRTHIKDWINSFGHISSVEFGIEHNFEYPIQLQYIPDDGREEGFKLGEIPVVYRIMLEKQKSLGQSTLLESQEMKTDIYSYDIIPGAGAGPCKLGM